MISSCKARGRQGGRSKGTNERTNGGENGTERNAKEGTAKERKGKEGEAFLCVFRFICPAYLESQQAESVCETRRVSAP
jgi:hypothetical protein